MTALQLTGLTKSFGETPALDNLELEVEAGEFFVILGASAHGKTTALRTIAGIERPDAGRIVFDGEDMTEAPVQNRGMAMVFQTFALYPHLTIFDNLAYPLREQRMPAADVRRRVNEIAEMLRLSHTLERKPATASGGEQQRVAIGRALVRSPKLLLLDEPLTNLDAKLRFDTRAEFKRLHRELGMTMVYATPDELEALSMGQRIGVLRHGKIVQTGTPDQLYDQPDDTYVAAMVGSPKMNLVPGLRGEDATGPFVELPFGRFAGGPWAGPLGQLPQGAEITLGFRPHDIRPANGAGEGPRVEVSVHLTEPLGDITVLDLAAGDVQFKMVLPEDQALAYPAGERFTAEFRLERSHLFDRASGAAIR
jgi:multiple sugar transport system ATP-binding protein